MSAAPGERVETETQHRPPVSSPHLLLTPPAHEKSPANPRRAKVPYSDPLSAAERLSSTLQISRVRRLMDHLDPSLPARRLDLFVRPSPWGASVLRIEFRQGCWAAHKSQLSLSLV